MNRADNVHSRVVGWLKILLPLAALALLSTLFLFARQTGTPPAIPFAELNQLAKEQQITAPRFTGVADDGSIIAITANTAKPGAGGALSIVAPRLSLDATDGTSLTIQAGTAQIDNETQLATLSGLARLQTSSGYLMETQGLIADLRSGEVTSTGPLEIQSPFGTLTAGAVTILASPDGLGQQMDFNKGVKLVYARPVDDVKDTK